MILDNIRWNNPNRKRRIDIRYTDKDYTRFYDVDLEDFTNLVMKLKAR